MHPLLIAVPAAAGLYYLLRKKPAGPTFTATPSAVRAAPVAPATPFVSPAAASPQQSAEDRAIVDAALAQFATEREFPIEEQSIDTGITPRGGGNFSPGATTVDATTGQPGQDFFVDPGSGLRAQNAPPPEEQIETPSMLASLADAANDPFGMLFGGDNDEE
jgi:hypothetical protein